MQLQDACRSKWPPLLKSISPFSALTPCCWMQTTCIPPSTPCIQGWCSLQYDRQWRPKLTRQFLGILFWSFAFLHMKRTSIFWILLPFCLAHHIFFCRTSAIGSVPLFVILPAYPDLCNTFCTSVHKTGLSGLDWKIYPWSGHWTLNNPEWEQIAVSL